MKLFNSVLVAAGLILSSSAFAHVGLSSTTPANGAMISQAPSTLELNFSAPVRLVKLAMQDENQLEVPLSVPKHAQSQANFAIALPALKPAKYTVSWMIMGDDGHKMKGEFGFMLHGAKAAAIDAATGTVTDAVKADAKVDIKVDHSAHH
ncbi:copper resistance protein CopC [Shewanella denitrificans OS217]|jgi:copper resistance protein C|uniref:Copper resistance protein C n=1 Tax=Shewanella denitrificans (strain OS217 / ATCC BAA-1090 / DSM 15013) TaxID=318161 RepID=Q12IA7_SHEDO|nr:copper resistance CopC family protein [Shewanella denitrificans]ABE56819.1 copper resistance protein CopC [Shewanella denitrificans OS217]